MERRFPGQRALRIGLRTLHLAAMAVLVGAAIHGTDLELGLVGTLATGMALSGEALWRYGRDWFRWLQAWVVMAKLLLLVAALAWPAWRMEALWAALAAGSIISHAPGRIRQWPLWGEPGPCARKGCKLAQGGVGNRNDRREVHAAG